MRNSHKGIFLIVSLCILSGLNGCMKKSITASAEKSELSGVKEEAGAEVSMIDVKDDLIVHVPTREEVEEKRKEVLVGMTEEDAGRLIAVIKRENLAWEHAFMWNNLEKELSDPESLSWNIIDKTGWIQIGWGYDSEVYQEKKTDELTMDEFLEMYGTPVMTENYKDADAFCRKMEELKSTISNEALRKDFDQLISNMQSAKETHDVTYIRKVHEILHDMDYYLLRYGPTEMGSYVSDLSLVCTYYGVLEVYKG